VAIFCASPSATAVLPTPAAACTRA
jgi:hypothetical protein